MRGPDKLIVAKDVNHHPAIGPDTLLLAFEDVKAEIRSGRILSRLFRFREATLLTGNIEYLSKPLFVSILVRALGRSKARLADTQGREKPVTLARILLQLWSAARDAVSMPALLRKIERDVRAFSAPIGRPKGLELDPRLPPFYLRTDLSYGIVSGGSVGHIGGVLNNLDHFFAKPLFITSDAIPGVRKDLAELQIRPTSRYFDFREIPSFHFNYTLMDRLHVQLPAGKPAFIYQRYSLNNFTGIWLSRRLKVPLVLEFNGSEIWVGRNWGKPLIYEALSTRLENLNLSAADLVVVVSRPLKDMMVKDGVDPEKVLVNPNGVNQDIYSPAVDGSPVRACNGLEGKIVVGFIGTFGDWHGAEVLAEAYGRLMAARPDLRDRMRLLMIGDGVRLPKVKEAIARHGIGDVTVLTGLIPQKEGPAHLAACDILVSPHVPNPDGTPFFGSPTKLFEYMAMGKGIVASDLDQIGEILEHDRTAWMTRPGDPDSLMEGLAALADDPALRERLGRAAREEAVAKYTWREHTRKIIERLKELVA